jgi:hypothetical protein
MAERRRQIGCHSHAAILLLRLVLNIVRHHGLFVRNRKSGKPEDRYPHLILLPRSSVLLLACSIFVVTLISVRIVVILVVFHVHLAGGHVSKKTVHVAVLTRPRISSLVLDVVVHLPCDTVPDGLPAQPHSPCEHLPERLVSSSQLQAMPACVLKHDISALLIRVIRQL